MHHHNGNAKLNPQKVREMLKLRGEGYSYPQLARLFKVSTNTVQKICTGQSWQNVTQGQEILTDGEVQLRQLTTPGPTPQEIQASQEKFLRLLKAQEAQDLQGHGQAQDQSSIPEQYRGVDTSDPEAYQREIQRMIEEARQRTLHNGSPPAPVPVRQPIAHPHPHPHSNAEKLLETLKDAIDSSDKSPDDGAVPGSPGHGTQSGVQGGSESDPGGTV